MRHQLDNPVGDLENLFAHTHRSNGAVFLMELQQPAEIHPGHNITIHDKERCSWPRWQKADRPRGAQWLVFAQISNLDASRAAVSEIALDLSRSIIHRNEKFYASGQNERVNDHFKDWL